MQPQTLEEYLDTYGGLLAEQAVRQCAPLHDPAEDAPASLDKLLRKPYKAQAHIIAAGAQALKRQRGVVLSCQMGTGKSLLAQGVCEQHSGGKPYRTLVMCPPHLCEKWEREIKLTIPRALVIHLNHFSQLTRVRKGIKPTGKSWWIMSTSKAKLGPPWEQQTIQRRALPREYQEFQQLAKILRLCPECQAPIKMEQKKAAHGTCFASEGDLNKNRMQCPQCESPLWAWTHQMDRWPMANLIHKRMKNFFNYLVADECFPAGTMIATPDGERPIESIRPGDAVLSFGGSGVVCRVVRRLIAKRNAGGLVTVKTESGAAISCTPNHKFYTAEGLAKKAKDLQNGEKIRVLRDVRGSNEEKARGQRQVADDVLKEMRAIPGVEKEEAAGVSVVIRDRAVDILPRMRSDVSAERPSEVSSRGIVLRKVLLRQVHGDEAILEEVEPRDTGEGQKASCPDMCRKNESPERKPGVQGHACGEGCSCNKGQAIRWEEGWEWSWANGSPKEIGGHDRGLRAGVPSEDGAEKVAGVRGGHSVSVRNAGGRVRRGIASHKKAGEQGSDERGDTVQPRLDSDSGLEQPNREESSVRKRESFGDSVLSVCYEPGPEGVVFDLEVDGEHNYFANGALVSNCHQAKSDESAIGQAFGSLSAACRKTICLTGTLLGGYAWHVRPMMFRIAPKTMVEEGLGWDGEALFNERYGRFERIQTETKGFGTANRQSKGKAKVTNNRYVRPGIMPTLYARHLIGQTIFLDLEDVADALPGRVELPQGVPMDRELSEAYGSVEKAIKDALAAMGRRKNRSLLSQMLHTLLSYPDCPYGWGPIGYYTEDTHEWVHVVDPPNLSKRFLAKEIALLDLVNEQKSQGRQVWNYYTYTNKPRVGNHLEELFAKHGFSVAHMTSKISPMDREKWMAQHCPGKDVVLSHPQLVETGLDFFDKAGTYNFPTLCFYETGYNLFTLMQAAGRAWRIGQRANCETRYLYYQGTMQQKAVSLMGRKQQASRAVEGKFSAEGLAALLDGHDSIEMELAKSLTENLGDEWEVGW